MNPMANPAAAVQPEQVYPVSSTTSTSERLPMNQTRQMTRRMVFVPFSETLMEQAGSPLGTLVPFDLSYDCVRLADGTYDFTNGRL